ncbi:MAG: hypothetical protein KDE35_07125 [Geminicoccaceae bacterium]|nr:hypothetical protein [Geminicoccaceae bacterium]
MRTTPLVAVLVLLELALDVLPVPDGNDAEASRARDRAVAAGSATAARPGQARPSDERSSGVGSPVEVAAGIGRDHPDRGTEPAMFRAAPTPGGPSASVDAADWQALEPSAGGVSDGAAGTADDADIAADRGLAATPERALDMSTSDLEDVARDLMRRREAIERREAALNIEQRTLELLRQDLRSYVAKIEGLRDEVAALVETIDEEDRRRIEQLVDVYEKMKAKQAAAIFDRLEPDVLLEVARRMREAKLAAVLARMDPPRARFLTTELARGRPQLQNLDGRSK